MESCDCVLFEISLQPDAVAVSISDFSEYKEFEILIAVSMGLLVESVDWITVSNSDPLDEVPVPCVELRLGPSLRDFFFETRIDSEDEEMMSSIGIIREVDPVNQHES
jgi:hypothetical protein